MIKLESTEVFGWEAAIRGMRNPMNSWEKSDSGYRFLSPYSKEPEYIIGEADLKLMKSLSKAGTDHSKFLRMINVTLDITAPLYWWKEFDTYKVGTVANSCSTMHKIHAKEFTLDDFSCESCPAFTNGVMETLEAWRKKYLETKDKRYWKELVRWLPNGWLQTRTVTMNYENLRSIAHQRAGHKLSEWRAFCEWCEQLPYAKELIID